MKKVARSHLYAGAIWGAMLLLVGCGGSGSSSGGLTSTTGGGTTGKTAGEPAVLPTMTAVFQTNKSGAALGDFDTNAGTTNALFRTASGAMITLKGLDGTTQAFAAALNNSNVIVGTSSGGPTYWVNGGNPAALTVLQDQYTSGSSYNITGINDSGQVLGSRGYLTPEIDETQTVTVTGNPTGGQFYIHVDYSGPQDSANLPYNATAADLQAALRVMGEIGSGVTCSGGPLPNQPIVVTFQNGGIYLGPMTPETQFTGGSSPKMTMTVTRQPRPSQQVTEALFWSSVTSTPTPLSLTGLTPTSLANNGWIGGYTTNPTNPTYNNPYTGTYYKIDGPSGSPTGLATYTWPANSAGAPGNCFVNASGMALYRSESGALMLFSGSTAQQISSTGTPYGITSDGTAYGSTGSYLTANAFVYTKSKGLVNLNNLLPKGSTWVLESARCISDNGFVVGEAKEGNNQVLYLYQLPAGYY